MDLEIESSCVGVIRDVSSRFQKGSGLPKGEMVISDKALMSVGCVVLTLLVTWPLKKFDRNFSLENRWNMLLKAVAEAAPELMRIRNEVVAC